jgi:hypothetical protein
MGVLGIWVGFLTGKEISIYSQSSRPTLVPTQPPAQRIGVPFPAIKATGREFDYLPPHNAEVKNETRYNSAPT